MSTVSPRRTFRTILRWIVGSAGVAAGITFLQGGMADQPLGMMGMMFVFMAGTDFCAQCPLLSYLKRFVGRGPKTKIPVDRI